MTINVNVSTAGDWLVVSKDNKLIFQGHTIRHQDLVSILRKLNPDTEIHHVLTSADEMDELEFD